MLKAMALTNFKCFQRQEIDFRPLTLLTGVNSAGKSTVIQALLLLQQNFASCGEEAESSCPPKRRDTGGKKLFLSGDLVNLGLPEDVLYSNADDDTFAIAIERDEATFALKAVPDGNELHAEWNLPACPDLAHLQYLHADRLCPQTLFPIPKAGQLASNAIGNKGEFAAYHLETFGQRKILHADASGPNLLAADAAGDSTSLQIQTEAWLSRLGAPVHIQTDRPAGTDTVVLRFSFPDISRSYYRPTNVGFGLTYALPVFVAALRAPVGSLLIVENPEAHLHPKGQALMGHFLARAAACGVQVIIETHSDHVLNGIRVAVKQDAIAHENVQINFFHQQDGTSCVRTPRIDKDGHLDLWPEDFFDEWDKQLSELL
ncbi:DUF3696 domain-containing protein [Desulfovibrio sp. ZJ369]|uniref:AAA family ATPase n=1 Tax=Desulfovibrio sp. ZJ369 TaxID=2709793 RepID=UPI0013ED9B13|nr:DUF3696 domain-containing protein [Desulfovibrio sp. ZJ369]